MFVRQFQGRHDPRLGVEQMARVINALLKEMPPGDPPLPPHQRLNLRNLYRHPPADQLTPCVSHDSIVFNANADVVKLFRHVFGGAYIDAGLDRQHHAASEGTRRALGLEHLYVVCHGDGEDKFCPLAQGISAVPLQALVSIGT